MSRLKPGHYKAPPMTPERQVEKNKVIAEMREGVARMQEEDDEERYTMQMVVVELRGLIIFPHFRK